ncbi:hypothetical protein DOTSEDRAFT_123052 [Dothistroma septosporum NZE10]|uniref:DUF1275 domain protein n=1 Tax=Dothistroma septosporum (strain NZE10 / CBS 128990) TaxID=675120 RepID=N1PYR3_DOTSN|nr:hypothetical protein DOTSEDRAFT_123052 [Dothistroma septosporum NZE10]
MAPTLAPHSVPEPNARDNSAHGNTAIEGHAVEKPKPVRRQAGIFSSARLFGPVTKQHGDLPLLACCFVTGLIDAASFSNWGVFVGMQTGNTVILGLSTAGLPANPHAWLTTLVSLGSFLMGALLTFRISNYIAPKGPTTNRLWAGSLFFIQGVFILIAAALATPNGLIPQNPGSTGRTSRDPAWVLESILIAALIPPLAFQSGMQIAASRLLGFNELPVNVLTSTYCDIMGDFKLLALNNVKRNRRVVAAVLLLTGAICSGWLMRSSAGLEGVLWISSGIKISVGVAMWCFLPAVEETALP